MDDVRERFNSVRSGQSECDSITCTRPVASPHIWTKKNITKESSFRMTWKEMNKPKSGHLERERVRWSHSHWIWQIWHSTYTRKRLPLRISLSTFCLSLHSFLSLSSFHIPWGLWDYSSKTKYLMNLHILSHLSILLRMWHPLPFISQIKTFPSDAHEANVFRFINRTQLTLSEEKRENVKVREEEDANNKE